MNSRNHFSTIGTVGLNKNMEWKGIEMLKLISFFIAVFVTQLIAIIMWGEHVWLYKFAHGGVGGSPIDQIQPIFWLILIIEAILFGLLIASFNRKTNK